MNKKQYRAALDKLGLSIVGAAQIGISRRQSQRLAAGTVVPTPLANLIKLMLAKRVTPDKLNKIKIEDVL